MSKINWVYGAEFYAYGNQYKIINNTLYYFSPYEVWSESSHSFSALKNSDDYQINPNISEVGAASESAENCTDGDKYNRTIYGKDGTKTTVDIYRVLDAFPTGSASCDHAIKKMLCPGKRGHKDLMTDIDNAIESLQEYRKLLIQKESSND